MSLRNHYLSIPPGIEYFSLQKTKIFTRYKKKVQEWLENHHFIEFIPPLFDYMELFLIHHNPLFSRTSNFAERIFEVKDSNGEYLSLRSDITVMAMKSYLYQLETNRNLKYYYIQPVYRDYRKELNYSREIYQIGVEWIGHFPERIRELIYHSSEILNMFSQQYTIVAGNSRFIKKLLSLYPEESRQEIVQAFFYKNQYSLKEIIKKYELSGTPARYLLEIPYLIGDGGILEELKKLLREHNELFTVCRETVESFPERNVLFDFSLVREFDYYTDIIFEAYSKKNSTKILSGGIYDDFSLHLSSIHVPACGFAINFTGLLQSLEETS